MITDKNVIMKSNQNHARKSRVKAYFYHTENIQYMYDGWVRGTFPGHLLYGATHLDNYGVDIVKHKFREFGVKRLPMMLYVA